MEIRCPRCGSSNVKSLALAYQEGLSRVDGRIRLRGVVVGAGGPDLVVATATTHESHQTALSKRLRPPAKWSYRKTITRSAVGVLSLGWLIFYTHAVTATSSAISSPAFELSAWLSSLLFAFLLFLVWKHNHFTYERQLVHWNQSFLCQRCGSVSEQELISSP